MGGPGVLLFGNHPLPYGGVPRHVESLAGFLADRGWTVHVLSMAGERRAPERTCGYTIHRPSRGERFGTSPVWSPGIQDSSPGRAVASPGSPAAAPGHL